MQYNLKEKETVADLIDRFLASQDVARGSKVTYRSALRQFFNWFKRKRVENPTRETILDYKEWLDTKGLRPFTRSGYLVAVRRFFEWAETLKLYPNIAKGIKGARRSIKTHQKNALTIEQVERLLKSISFVVPQGLRDYALINLLFRTGLRLIEIKRANIVDIEAKDDEPDNAILWVRGKGRDGKDDFVVLTEEALKPIMRYLKVRKPQSSQEPLFASLSDRNFGGQITTQSLSRIIKARLRFAGMDSRRITAHSLRHTFGVMAIKAGASLYEVQLAMRHTAPTTTEIYLGDIERSKRMEGGPEKRISKLFAGIFDSE
jgi:integrase/recombinase XerC/integrase/recombinase XerD